MDFETLKKNHSDFAEKISAILQERDLKIKEIKSDYEPGLQELSDSMKKKMEQYFDSVLLDKEGNTVKVGAVISDDKNSYKVIDRGLQIIFGTILENPRCAALKYNKDLTLGKKEHHFNRKDLKEFKIETNWKV